MSSCHACGRPLQHDNCTCLHTNPLKKSEVFFILFLLMSVPAFTYAYLSHDTPIFSLNYLFIGSIILSSILVLLTMMDYMLKRPYLAMVFGCHQFISRTIILFKYPLPLCARCTGIYLGVIFSIIVFYIFDLGLLLSLLFGIPLIIDGYLQKKKNISSNNTRRFITGLLFGITFVALYSAYNASLVYLLKLIFPF
ncbi:MAG: DUF2085 domain-containing protein [Candidatus Izemoplasmataceae bacterium]